MASTFPTTLDSFTNPASTDKRNDPPLSEAQSDQNDAIEALQAKVGVDSSAVTTSLDYLLTNASSEDPGHTHTLAAGATDITASVADINAVTNFEQTLSSTTSKLTVTDGAIDFDIASHDGTNGLKLGGTLVTSSAAELNYVDGVTSAIQTQLNTKLASTSYDDATAAEVNTGTSTAKYVSPDSLAGSNTGIRYVQMPVFEWSSEVSTGDGKFYLHIPPGLNGMNLVYVHAEDITAATGTGTETTDIMIYNVTQAADMLSVALTIDEDETGSDTAATAATIDTSEDDVATNDVLRIDVDAVPSTTPGEGLIITLGFQLP